MTSQTPERLAQAAGPMTPARFSVTIDGYEIASFSKLQGLPTASTPARSRSPSTRRASSP